MTGYDNFKRWISLRGQTKNKMGCNLIYCKKNTAKCFPSTSFFPQKVEFAKSISVNLQV